MQASRVSGSMAPPPLVAPVPVPAVLVVLFPPEAAAVGTTVIVTCADADFVVSAADVAVTVTVAGVGADAGAV